MSDKEKLRELAEITDLVFAMQSAEIQETTRQQALIESKLAKLSKASEDAQARFQSDVGLRFGGADVMWQAWLGQQRKSLNTELAAVLAEKERRLQKMKFAFGRKEVAAKMCAEAAAIKRSDERDP
ncbi:hypothetical protein E7681_09345 [Thalassobius vesicularis]|uniref:Flagellar FliJ protein n=1 Tax=Thalassobius vesicularis TaxID=1294297 RepID=A0A4S3MAG3_9RHOB|nr:hypothetical protein [Thalassobius vesicularis]THD73810.1 hypothetical protein E7681_09345 [Thalassobius vesicularis]